MDLALPTERLDLSDTRVDGTPQQLSFRFGGPTSGTRKAS
jgi:hypothetical protein